MEKPIIELQQLLEPTNINRLVGKDYDGVKDTLNELIYGKDSAALGSALRIIPIRGDAKYPEDAVDLVTDSDEEVVMATSSHLHKPPIPIYRRYRESEYRKVTTADLAKMEFRPAFFGLSTETRNSDIFPGYTDGTHSGETADGYPFFSKEQLECLVFELDGEIRYDPKGAIVELDSMDPFRVPVFKPADHNLPHLYWWGYETAWRWGRPEESLEALLPEIHRVALVSRAVQSPDTDFPFDFLVQPEDFDAIKLSVEHRIEILNNYLGGYSFIKHEDDQVDRHYEFNRGRAVSFVLRHYKESGELDFRGVSSPEGLGVLLPDAEISRNVYDIQVYFESALRPSK